MLYEVITEYQSYKEKLIKLNATIDDRNRTRILSTLKSYSFRAVAASFVIAVISLRNNFV